MYQRNAHPPTKQEIVEEDVEEEPCEDVAVDEDEDVEEEMLVVGVETRLT